MPHSIRIFIDLNGNFDVSLILWQHRNFVHALRMNLILIVWWRRRWYCWWWWIPGNGMVFADYPESERIVWHLIWRLKVSIDYRIFVNCDIYLLLSDQPVDSHYLYICRFGVRLCVVCVCLFLTYAITFEYFRVHSKGISTQITLFGHFTKWNQSPNRRGNLVDRLEIVLMSHVEWFICICRCLCTVVIILLGFDRNTH